MSPRRRRINKFLFIKKHFYRECFFVIVKKSVTLSVTITPLSGIDKTVNLCYYIKVYYRQSLPGFSRGEESPNTLSHSGIGNGLKPKRKPWYTNGLIQVIRKKAMGNTHRFGGNTGVGTAAQRQYYPEQSGER